MKQKRIYKYRVSEGARDQMRNALIYPMEAFAIEDGELCRILDPIPDSSFSLKDKDLVLKHPFLYIIAIHKNTTGQSAVIFPSLLEELNPEEWIFEADQED